VEYRWRFISLLHHGIENNYLSDGRPSCIRFWETESDSLVLFGFEIGIFFRLTKIVHFQFFILIFFLLFWSSLLMK
jgi:hypothetical protein